MRCKFLLSIALSMAAAAVLASVSAAADDPSSAAQSKETPSAAAKQTDAVQSPTPTTKSKTGVPTPAKRKADAIAIPIEVPSKSEPASSPSSNLPQAAAQPKTKTADEPLRPIPDSLESGSLSVEVASFKGVTPGVSTKEDVEKAWGSPKQMAASNGSLVELYSVEPFNRVEVNYSGKTVSSVVIRFDRAFPADAVAKQLDLATVRPVLVANELGEVLGLAYPERGVLFAFESGKEPDKPSMKVSQIVLEPISAEPFVLRAETTLESRCDLSRRDLEQAISLEPTNARAHWLHSRALVAMSQYDKAAAAAGEAVRLDPENPRYRTTRAQVLAQAGRLSEAIDEAQKAVDTSNKALHIKARALCLVGDLTASGPKPDYQKAITFHTQALQIADPLASDSRPAIRVAAKEVLIDAHLGAAHDIAWGEWKEKNNAVGRWIERAVDAAEDLMKNEGGSAEQVFRVHVRAMAAYVGMRGSVDPEPTVKAIVTTGDALIAAAGDPVRKAQLQWDLGMALYDAVQISQMRTDHDSAMKYGEKAAEYLAKANAAKQSPASAFMLGRLYFRLGTIHALRDHDHHAAVVWFDKAIPLLDRSSPEDVAADVGRHGESLVSMGVSYWEVGQREKAVTLTEKGIKWMEQAVAQGSMVRPSLAIPYNNLAAMHRKLGSTDKAEQFQEMASRAKKEKLH
jgi:tetratricopeptide (TPR) repeat protein